MKYVDYRQSPYAFMQDFAYASNISGKVCVEEKVPESVIRELAKFFHRRQSSRCHIVKYKGEYRIALINEFGWGGNPYWDTQIIYKHLQGKAEEFARRKEFRKTDILLAYQQGIIDRGSELIVVLPRNISGNEFDIIEEIISGTIWR